MRRVDGIVGNVDDDAELADRMAAHERNGTLERVALDAADRKKSRLRVTTDAGTDFGVLVDRPELRAGDVLVDDGESFVVVAFDRLEAFVIELPEPTPEALASAVELGHRIGNQHWGLALDGSTVYVPVEADRRIIENVLGEYLPNGSATRYESVDAELFTRSTSSEHHHTHEHGHAREPTHHHESEHDASHTGHE